MKFFYLISLILLCCFNFEEIFPEYNDVIVLTDITFTRGTNEFKYLLVFFFDPSCTHCKELHPEYEKAAVKLKKENLYLARVDASMEQRLVDKYSIQEYPKIMFFVRGKKQEYTGGRKEEEIIQWVKENSIPDFKELKTVEDIENFKKKNEVCVIYFGDLKKDKDEITIAERKIYDIPFGMVENEEIIKKYSKKGTLVLFKTFDEKKNELTEIKAETVEKFIQTYSLPKVIGFDFKTAPIIFGKKKPAFVIMGLKDSPQWGDYQKILSGIADKYIGKILLVLADIREGMAVNLAEFLGVKYNDIPTARIIDPSSGDPKKYKLEGEINEQNIIQFINKWEKGQLTSFLKSEPIPEGNYGDVAVVVGKNFKKEVLENDKDVMVYFYAPWCTHCKENYIIYEKVAKKLKKNNPKIVLAKMDSTANDIENMVIERYPTIKFYPGNKKDKKPIDYRRQKTEKDFIDFIKEKSFHKVVLEDFKDVKKEEKIVEL